MLCLPTPPTQFTAVTDWLTAIEATTQDCVTVSLPRRMALNVSVDDLCTWWGSGCWVAAAEKGRTVNHDTSGRNNITNNYCDRFSHSKILLVFIVIYQSSVIE